MPTSVIGNVIQGHGIDSVGVLCLCGHHGLLECIHPVRSLVVSDRIASAATAIDFHGTLIFSVEHGGQLLPHNRLLFCGLQLISSKRSKYFPHPSAFIGRYHAKQDLRMYGLYFYTLTSYLCETHCTVAIKSMESHHLNAMAPVALDRTLPTQRLIGKKVTVQTTPHCLRLDSCL